MLTDRNEIAEELSSKTFDYVVHLAAISAVTHADELALYRVNLLGTCNLLEVLAAIRNGVGEDFPITLRISGYERVAGGRTLDDTARIAPQLAAAGVRPGGLTGRATQGYISNIPKFCKHRSSLRHARKLGCTVMAPGISDEQAIHDASGYAGMTAEAHQTNA